MEPHRSPTRPRLIPATVAAVCLLAAAHALAPAGKPSPAQRRPAVASLADVPCTIFPADNIWNVPVDDLPVHPRSAEYVARIGADRYLHPDFGSGTWMGGPMGIPFVVVPGDQPPVPVEFVYPQEADPGPYPIPPDVEIEGGRLNPNNKGDRHVIVVDQDNCVLYELFHAWPQEEGKKWRANSGAIFDLRSHGLRPHGWTSADAAGLPILAGLLRYEEVAAGEIRHALRFTAPQTQRAFVWPARHYASKLTDPALPPMGQRFRLRKDFDVSRFDPEIQVVLRALQKYGLMLADNGSSWYIQGAPDPRWDNDLYRRELHQVFGRDFEAVDVTSLMLSPHSGRVRLVEKSAPAGASGSRRR